LLTLLFAIQKRWLRRLSLVTIILGFLSMQPLFLPHSLRLSLSILAYLQFFLIGFLLADIFLVDWGEAPPSHAGWDVVGFVGWPCLFVVLRSDTLTHWLFPFLILLLYCAAFRGPWSRRVFSSAWVTAIGGMCYSIYLIHYQGISAIGRFTKGIGEGSPFWLYLLIQLALIGIGILFISGLYFALLEKRCMRRDWPERVWGHLTGARPAREA